MFHRALEEYVVRVRREDRLRIGRIELLGMPCSYLQDEKYLKYNFLNGRIKTGFTYEMIVMAYE